MQPVLRLVPQPPPRSPQLEALWGGPEERCAIWSGTHWVHAEFHPEHRWQEHLSGGILLGACHGACSTVRCIGWDVDAHEEGHDAPAAVTDLVSLLLSEYSFAPFVVTSKSGKGYHVYVFFDRDVDTDRARALALTIRDRVARPEMCAVIPSASRTAKMSGQVFALPFCGPNAAVKAGGSIAVDPVDLTPLADGPGELDSWPMHDPTAALDALPARALVAATENVEDTEPAPEGLVKRGLIGAAKYAVGAPNTPEQLTLKFAMLLWGLGLNAQQRLAALRVYNIRRPVPWSDEKLERFVDAPRNCNSDGEHNFGWIVETERRNAESSAAALVGWASPTQPGRFLQRDDYTDLAASLKRRKDPEHRAAGVLMARLAIGEPLTDPGTPAEQVETTLATAVGALVSKHPDLDVESVAKQFEFCGTPNVAPRLQKAIDERPPLKLVKGDPPAATTTQSAGTVLVKQGRFWLRIPSGRYVLCHDLTDLSARHREEFGSPFGRKSVESQARSVETLRATYCSADTTYDESRHMLVQGTPLDPDIEPAWDNAVDDWFQALAGDRYADLIRQIVACDPKYLGSSCRATALVGSASVGKTLLVEAIARCWGTPAVKMVAAVAQFNGALATCPIVFADERLPKDYSGESFREFVAQHSHSVEPKGKERFTLDGCVRVWLAMNDVDQIRFAGKKGRADVEAISERLCVIQCQDAARAALEALREKNGVIDLRRIAGHIRYLWTCVPAIPSDGRFVGAAAAGVEREEILAQEIEDGEVLWEAIGRRLRDPAVERAYSDCAVPASVPGKPSEAAWQAWPIAVVDGTVYVRPMALAAALGVPTGQVQNWLKPTTVDRRATLRQSGRLARNLRVWQLDTAALTQAVGETGDLARDSRQP